MQPTKVTMDIALQGSVMYPREEVRKSPKEFTNHTPVWVNYKKWNKATHKKEEVNECLHVFTRKCIPAHQTMNLTSEAYDWMISEESILKHIKKSEWHAMSDIQRLEAHLADLCKSVQGVSFTYEILPD